jgi:N-sulfoglucosamine sulfohydrolase
MNRRDFFRNSGAGLMAIWAGGALAADKGDAPERPNLVVFISDDQHWFDSSPYGSKVIRTPAMQSIASDGLTFTRAFVASPTCSPSRATIHSGLHSARNGAMGNHRPMRKGVRTLPAYLQALGYQVVIAGKQHLLPADAYSHERIPGDVERNEMKRGLATGVIGKFLADRKKNRPLCLFVNAISPHVVWPQNKGYDPKKVNVPPHFVDTPETRQYLCRYYTDITLMDKQLGEVRAAVNRHLGDNTLFLFTSDQGAQWPFGKWNLYDAGIRVPLLAAWPGRIKPASTTGAMVSFLDILPTFIELAGGAAPKELDGKSFAPVLCGKAAEHHKEIYAAHTGDGAMNVYPIRCVRTEKFKYILNLFPANRYTTHIDKAGYSHDGGRKYYDSWVLKAKTDSAAAAAVKRYHTRPAEELYDIVKDPYEISNLAGDPTYAKVQAELKSKVKAWMKRMGDRSAQKPQKKPSNKRTAKPAPKQHTWRYTFKQPPEGWEAPGFDDSQWKQGKGGFGRIRIKAARVGTPWSTPDIWIRRTFDLKTAPQTAALRIFYDNNAEVHINGQQIAKFTGFSKNYFDKPLDAGAIKQLKTGSNTIAIHCNFTGGGQFIDADILVE